MVFVHDHRESSISTERYFPLNTRSDTQIFLKKSVRKKIKRTPPNDYENVYYNNKIFFLVVILLKYVWIHSRRVYKALSSVGRSLIFVVLTSQLISGKDFGKSNQSFMEAHEYIYEGFKKE